MAINKAVMAAIKALSYIDIDLVKNYKIERQIRSVSLLNTISQKSGRTRDFFISTSDHDVPVRLSIPNDDYTPLPLIVYFHGGGWVTGNIDTYNRLCLNMARVTGHNIVSVDYRLAPEFKFPYGLNDCCAVVRTLFSHIRDIGITEDMITLAGDSAGGNLAAAVSMMLRDKNEPIPAKQILIYPATYNDHTDSSPFKSIADNGTDYLLTSKKLCDYLALYMNSPADLQNPYFAPLMAQDFTNQPDTLIITAEFDPLRDEGEAYGEKLNQAGNYTEIYRIPDALHGYFALPPFYSQVRKTYDYINKFLKRTSTRTK